MKNAVLVRTALYVAALLVELADLWLVQTLVSGAYFLFDLKRPSDEAFRFMTFLSYVGGGMAALIFVTILFFRQVDPRDGTMIWYWPPAIAALAFVTGSAYGFVWIAMVAAGVFYARKATRRHTAEQASRRSKGPSRQLPF